MYAATFIFARGLFDDEYHRLDQEIADMAHAAPGHLGEKAWENPSTGLSSKVDDWETLSALQNLVEHPRHREAKREQGRWLDGYQVVISQALRMHGDTKLQGLLPLTRLQA